MLRVGVPVLFLVSGFASGIQSIGLNQQTTESVKLEKPVSAHFHNLHVPSMEEMEQTTSGTRIKSGL